MNHPFRIFIPGLLAGGAIGLCIGQGWISRDIGIGAAVVLAVALAVLLWRARRLPSLPAPLQETPMAPFTSSAPPPSNAEPGGTRTPAGGTYGDFVPNAALPGMRDPSRGHELERDALPAEADFSQPPLAPEPAGPGQEDRVRTAAFEKYQRRNGAPGDPLADWLEAEAEIARADGAVPQPLSN